MFPLTGRILISESCRPKPGVMKMATKRQRNPKKYLPFRASPAMFTSIPSTSAGIPDTSYRRHRAGPLLRALRIGRANHSDMDSCQAGNEGRASRCFFNDRARVILKLRVHIELVV